MADLSAAVLQYALDHEGEKVGKRGECWDLAQEALKALGGDTSRTTKYDWGRTITMQQAGPGDIIQFGPRCKYTITNADGKWMQWSTGPMHTAIITQVYPSGRSFAILHQNYNNKKLVTPLDWFFSIGQFTHKGQSITISEVGGKAKFYRPVT